uniref:Uncharacterized protein n=1 Tax=Arundo donax TaxID=35708 RepID=A0A0A9DLT0_ARUDO
MYLCILMFMLADKKYNIVFTILNYRFPIDTGMFPSRQHRFRYFQIISVVLDNIVSLSFSAKKSESESDLTLFRSFPTVFIPIYYCLEHCCFTSHLAPLYLRINCSGRFCFLISF